MKDTKIVNLVPILNNKEENEGKEPEYYDIVKMLRQEADRIEQDKDTEYTGAVFVIESEDTIQLFGWGPEINKTSDAYFLVTRASQILLD